jgi:8-oxo-dGTP pyrophosphatase MutT (NUDIX family)
MNAKRKNASGPVRPVLPRDAASLVILRQRRRGPEVLMGRRASRHRFMPNVFVFPGGRLDRADWVAPIVKKLKPSVAKTLLRKWSKEKVQGLAVAAVRETHEETGLRIGAMKNGALRPDLSGLDYIARAITPPVSPIRFHARFFMTDAERAEGTATDSPELGQLQWLTLEKALQLPIADVTEFVLQEVQRRSVGWQPPGIPLFCYRNGAAMIHYEG